MTAPLSKRITDRMRIDLLEELSLDEFEAIWTDPETHTVRESIDAEIRRRAKRRG